MTTYRGEDWEVRIAEAEADLAVAPTIPYVTTVDDDVDPGITHRSKGIGYRTQEVKEGPIAVTGSIERDYDETAVIDSSTFREAVETDVTGAMTPLYIKLTNKVTGSTVTYRRLKGKRSSSVDQDGFAHETYNFWAEEIAFG